MTEQLKPCPFCGSNKNVSLKCQTTFTKGSLFWVECECGVGCGAECGEFNNPIDAILSWGLKEMEQLQARIKELETEKETRYQEGKSEIISKLINDVPNPNYINDFFEKFSVYTPRGDDDEDVSWDVDKLKQYFDIERNFTSSYEKFQQILDRFHWGAMALEDNCMKKKDFINYIVRDDTTHNLENYIKHKINEIKAQGIEEAIKKADGETYIYPIGTDALNQQYRSELKCYAETLRAKYEKEI